MMRVSACIALPWREPVTPWPLPVVPQSSETALRVVPPPAATRDEIAAELRPLLVKVARRLCAGSPSQADDLLQDTLLKFMQHPKAPQDDVSAARAWCTRVMTNLFVDHCRARTRRPEVEAPQESLPSAESSGVAEWRFYDRDDLVRAVGDLPDDMRSVYWAHLKGESYAKIASQNGIKPATVGSRLHRARALLRDLLRRNKKPSPGAKHV